MNDVLHVLLSTIEGFDRKFDYSVVREWPQGVLEKFCELKILRQASGGMYARCPNCEISHVENVIIASQANGSNKYFIPCPESMRVEVEPDMCKLWEIDLEGISGLLRLKLQLKGKGKEILPGKLWELGKIAWPLGGKRKIMFAIRVEEIDAQTLDSKFGADGKVILIVPHLVSEKSVWRGKPPAIISLSDVMSFEDGEVIFDVEEIVAIVQNSDDTPFTIGGLAIGDKELKSIVRQQIKADKKTELTDDIFVAAYKQEGSYRKGAEFLTEQTGQSVSKDKIKRAVDRNGGVAEIQRMENSNSVARTVASQPRDRGKKFEEYS